MAHLSNLEEDTTYPSAERAKFKGMHLKYRNAKYPLYLGYFNAVLTPAAELGLHFQREAIDVVGAVHGIKSYFRIIGKLKESSARSFLMWSVAKILMMMMEKMMIIDNALCTTKSS